MRYMFFHVDAFADTLFTANTLTLLQGTLHV